MGRLSTAWWNFRRGVKNLWVYRKLIWQTADWDYAYLLELMEFKLRRMDDAIGNGCLLHRERKAKQMRVCAELCRRIRKDEYYANLTGPVKYNSWTTPCEYRDAVQLHIEGYRNGVLMTASEARRFYAMAERNRKNDIEYLFLVMRKHLLEWWD